MTVAVILIACATAGLVIGHWGFLKACLAKKRRKET